MSKPKHTITFAITGDIHFDQRMQRICSSLSSNGFDVRIYYRKAVSTSSPSEFPFKTVNLNCNFNKGFLFYAEYNLRLLFALWASTSSIYCAVDLDTLIPIKLKSWLSNKKLVYDAHEYYVESPELLRRPMVKWFWRLVARLILPSVKHNYTVNAILAKELTRRYKQKYFAIRNVPLLEEKVIQNARGEKIIIYQGVLNVGRGLEQMIQLMDHVKWAKLWIAGEGDISESLKKEVENRNLKDRISFLGKIEPFELKKITTKAWLGINILDLSSDNYRYSLANKFFDYMHAGIPNLSMNTETYREANRGNRTAILIDELDVNEIKVAIENLRNDAGLYDELAENCKKARQIHNWQNEEKKLIAFYEGLL